VNLSTKEAELVFSIMGDLSYGYGSVDLRRIVGTKLLDLLDAQYLASYVWNPARDTFVDGVSINMRTGALNEYDHYFRYCDPITPVLRRRRKATCVSGIMQRDRLVRTEFYNDFLARQGMVYGVNYYAYAANTNVGDFRIWRGAGREDFGVRDLELLDAIGPAFANAMRVALNKESPDRLDIGIVPGLDRLAEAAGLTAREVDVCAGVLGGLTDKEIARSRGISFTTVRTHLKHIYAKTGISGRTQLFGLLIARAKPASGSA